MISSLYATLHTEKMVKCTAYNRKTIVVFHYAYVSRMATWQNTTEETGTLFKMGRCQRLNVECPIVPQTLLQSLKLGGCPALPGGRDRQWQELRRCCVIVLRNQVFSRLRQLNERSASHDDDTGCHSNIRRTSSSRSTWVNIFFTSGTIPCRLAFASWRVWYTKAIAELRFKHR